MMLETLSILFGKSSLVDFLKSHRRKSLQLQYFAKFHWIPSKAGHIGSAKDTEIMNWQDAVLCLTYSLYIPGKDIHISRLFTGASTIAQKSFWTVPDFFKYS